MVSLEVEIGLSGSVSKLLGTLRLYAECRQSIQLANCNLSVGLQ